MATKDDPSLIDRFARSVATALVVELGKDEALSRLTGESTHTDGETQRIYADVIAALRKLRDDPGEEAAE